MAGERQTTPFIESLRGFAESFLNVVIGVMLASMVVIVFGNVIFRYFLNSAIAWSEEVSRFMLIWLSFLGAVIAFMKNEHLGLDLLVKYLPPIASRALVVLADVLVIIALFFMTKGGIEMTVDSFASGWVSSAVPIPYGYVYAIAPISSGLMLLDSFLKIFSDSAALVSTVKGRA